MNKIVFVTGRLYGGGAERVTAALMNELCKTVEVHLVETAHHHPDDEYPTDRRIHKHIIGKPSRFWPKLIAERIAFLRRSIGEIVPDCVVSLDTPKTNILLTIALLGQKVPVILSERNDPRRHPASKLIRALRIWIYSVCDGLVFQTHEAQQFFSSEIQQKSIVIHNPLSGHLPQRFDGERKQQIINCCRLAPQKNLDLLIDAFVSIADAYPDMKLVICGEGEERSRLEHKISELNMQHRILLPGFSDTVYDEINQSTMFVSSSDYEGMSNSMLEALALGVPTVCTDCPAGGAREVIRDGVNGLLVPTNDREALSAAMKRILDDPTFASTLGCNAEKLKDELHAGTIANQWLTYMKAISEKK